jgi:hypothetical protein
VASHRTALQHAWRGLAAAMLKQAAEAIDYKES